MIIIQGVWKEGFAFDNHIVKSVFKEEIQDWEHTRSEMAEYVYRLKYKQDINFLEKITGLLTKSGEFKKFIKTVDVIVPIPPTNKARIIQPVWEVSKEITKIFNKRIEPNIVRSANAEQIKNLDDKDKLEILKKSITVSELSNKNETILLFDDIYDSGSTLQVIADILIGEKGCKNVKVFTLTKTKGKK